MLLTQWLKDSSTYVMPMLTISTPLSIPLLHTEVAKYYTASRTLRTTITTTSTAPSKPVKPYPSSSTSMGGKSEERERRDTEKLVGQLEAEGKKQQVELADIEPLDPSDTESIQVSTGNGDCKEILE